MSAYLVSNFNLDRCNFSYELNRVNSYKCETMFNKAENK